MVLESNFLPVNGTTIHYQETGQGFPIVLVHAGIAHLEMWEAQTSFLAENFRVIAYDMRGYGKTPHVSGEYAHYQDLISLIDQLGIDRCILVGCSKGGGVVMDAALAGPVRVAGLIVVAGMANGLELEDYSDPPRQWEEAVKAFKAGDLERANQLEIQIWVDGYNQPEGRADESIRAKVSQMNAIALKNEYSSPEVEEKVLEPKVGTRLKEFPMPTLFLSGDLDEPDIHRAIEKMTEEMVDASQASIPGTAHLPNMEKPDKFNELILNFIEDVLSN